jgi:putative ABC transport system permease protein
MLKDLSSRLRALFQRSTVETELDDELRLHFDEQVEKYVRSGLAPAEAKRRTGLDFRGLDHVKEECRDARGVGLIEALTQDMRFALRLLRKSPSFTAAAVLTLALGIGANTAIFSIVDSLLLRPLPVEEPDQLTVLAFRQGQQGTLLTQFSLPDHRDISSQTTDAFSDMLGYMFAFDGLSHEGRADRIVTNYVTGNYFSVLGIKPHLGRFILPSEGRTPGADAVLVLSYSYWKTRFGGDERIVGKKVLLNGHPVTVVGVGPAGFHGLVPLASVQGYVPFGMVTTYEFGWPGDLMANRLLQNLHVLGRLNPGITLPRAAAALNVVASRLSTQYPDADKGLAISVFKERSARPDPETGRTLIEVAGLFLVLVALVLLLACVNVANMLLVRGTVREREICVRAALGAGRGRLIRQLLTESTLLALLGGLAGMLLGLWATRGLASIELHTFVPIRMDFGVDWRIFGYGFLAVLLTGILAGLVPALRASRGQLNDVLHESSRSVSGARNRLRGGLVTLQVAGSLMLLVVATLFAKSLARVQQLDLGFDPRNLVNLTMDPSEAGFNRAQGRAFYKSLLDRVSALPDVQSAALTSSTPLGDYSNNDYVRVSDYQAAPGGGLPLVPYSLVSPGFFPTIRVPILRGRGFVEGDDEGSPFVAIVNEAFAERFWPGRNPIGEHFAKVSGATNPLYEVVGVAKNSRFSGLTGPIDPYFYVPIAQDYDLSPMQVLQVRSLAPPEGVIRETEHVLRALAPELPLFNVQTMEQSLDSFSAFLLFRLGTIVAGLLGFLGLLLAVVGVYSVMSYSVSHRTHEIGLRMMLGAQRAQVLTFIIGQGVLIVGSGVILGWGAAFVVARSIANLLVGVSPTEPSTYLGVAFLLALVALAACYIPARRATRVDPMVALRYE